MQPTSVGSGTVADPYTAPTPTGKDYYLLRQLRARQTQRTAVEAEPAEAAPMRPQIYISQNASYFGSMDWNTDYKITVADALQSLADAGAIPQPWVDCALDWTDTESPDYTDYSGSYYPMNTVYYTFDSVGVLVLRRCMVLDGSVCTALSLTMDSRTGQVISVWISAPGEKRPARRRRNRADGLRRAGRAGKPRRLGNAHGLELHNGAVQPKRRRGRGRRPQTLRDERRGTAVLFHRPFAGKSITTDRRYIMLKKVTCT